MAASFRGSTSKQQQQQLPKQLLRPMDENIIAKSLKTARAIEKQDMEATTPPSSGRKFREKHYNESPVKCKNLESKNELLSFEPNLQSRQTKLREQQVGAARHLGNLLRHSELRQTPAEVKEQLENAFELCMLKNMVSYVGPVAMPRELSTGGKPKSSRKSKHKEDEETMQLEVIQTPPLPPPPSIDDFARALNSLIQLHQAEVESALKSPSAAVTIYVRDEKRRATCEFTMPQNVLIQHMGYFADLSKTQDLQDMDISISSDIEVFNWLISWIKYENYKDRRRHDASDPAVQASFKKRKPNLSVDNVTLVITAAWTLKMRPLFEHCLAFCHKHLKELVRHPKQLQNLDTVILDRLASLFNNEELEMVRECPEDVTAKFWLKLLQRLRETTPDIGAGHFYSLSSLFRCSRCKKCMSTFIESSVSCTPGNLRLNRWGQLIYSHVHDTRWNLDRYVTQLFTEFNSWRLVYWKLWCQCHFLYCLKCELHFPVEQLRHCRCHPEPAIAVVDVEGGSVVKYQYGCCGQTAFSFEAVQFKSGCRWHAHRVQLSSPCEQRIFAILEKISHNWQLFEADSVPVETSEPYADIIILPPRKSSGILPLEEAQRTFSWLVHSEREEAIQRIQDMAKDLASTCSNRRCNVALSDCEDEESTTGKKSARRKALVKQKPPNTNPAATSSSSTSSLDFSNFYTSRYAKRADWDTNLTPLNNQDNQRVYEERIMKLMADCMRKKLGNTEVVERTPIGGIYVRLEVELLQSNRKRQQKQQNMQSSVQSSEDNLESSSLTPIPKGKKSKTS